MEAGEQEHPGGRTGRLSGSGKQPWLTGRDFRNWSCQAPFHFNGQKCLKPNKIHPEGSISGQIPGAILSTFWTSYHQSTPTLLILPKPGSSSLLKTSHGDSAWCRVFPWLFCSAPTLQLRFRTCSNSQCWATLLPSLDPPPSINSGAKFPGSNPGSTTCWLCELLLVP